MASSPEQKRIASLEHGMECAMYWLLKSDNSTYDDHCDIITFLCNHGLSPASKQAKALLKRPMEAYHFELEKAVKRATK